MGAASASAYPLFVLSEVEQACLDFDARDAAALGHERVPPQQGWAGRFDALRALLRRGQIFVC